MSRCFIHVLVPFFADLGELAELAEPEPTYLEMGGHLVNLRPGSEICLVFLVFLVFLEGFSLSRLQGFGFFGFFGFLRRFLPVVG